MGRRSTGSLATVRSGGGGGTARHSGAPGAPTSVLRLLDGPFDWPDLYRIYEVIKADIGGDPEIAERRWATDADLTRFRRSANHPQVAGDRSRHGSTDDAPPPRPMDLRHAVALIKRLARNYLLSGSDTKS
jgi:hypothetical protein